MQKIAIVKESTSPVLEEEIAVFIDGDEEANKFMELLNRTWPATKAFRKKLLTKN